MSHFALRFLKNQGFHQKNYYYFFLIVLRPMDDSFLSGGRFFSSRHYKIFKF